MFGGRKNKVLATVSMAALVLLSVVFVSFAETNLVVGVLGDFQFLDRAKLQAIPDIHIQFNVYGGLLDLNEEGDYIGDLANNWSVSEDNLTYTFYLRNNVYFHNGRQCVASDVKFSFERLLDPETAFSYASFFKLIKEVEVIDDYTVAINLEEPYAYFLMALTRYFSVFAKENIPDIDRHPIGTGPYKFVEYSAGRYLKVEAFEDYWREGEPKTDSIEFRVFRDAETQILALEAGEIDIADRTSSENALRFVGNPDFTVYAVKNSTVPYVIFFDCSTYPTNNKLVRQALMYCMDKEEINEAATFGLGNVGYDVPLPEGHWALHPDIENLSYHRDVEKAKELLRQAGYESPSDLEITVWTSPHSKLLLDSAVVYLEQLKSVGITAELVQWDWSAYVDMLYINIKPFNVAFTGHGRDYDPEPLFAFCALSPALGTGVVPESRFYNKAAYSLRMLATQVAAREERNKFYYPLQELLIDEAPDCTMFFGPITGVMKETVKGYCLRSTGYNGLREVYLAAEAQ